MRRRILISAATIAAAAVAFGAGVVVQRQYQLAPIRVAEAAVRDLTGLDDPVPPAPPWDEWHYPNAEVKASVQGSSLRVMGELVRPAGRYAVLVTTDEFEDVARFYAAKTHFEAPDAMAKSRSAVSSYGTLQGESNHLLDDFDDPNDPQKSRPVRAKCMIRRCPSYDLTVFITRADGEAQTHVVLLYDPKTETGSERL